MRGEISKDSRDMRRVAELRGNKEGAVISQGK